MNNFEEDFCVEQRNPDSPILKERLGGLLFGQILGILDSKGLVRNKDYDCVIREMFQCSTKILYVEVNPIYQFTLYINTIDLSMEFGILNKETNEVPYRNKLSNLRYKISEGEDLELIDSHQVKWEEWVSDFKTKLNGIINGEVF